MVPLSTIFNISYGSKLDANKLESDPSGVNFVTRSSKNLGISGKVALVGGKEPLAAGLITVTMGGTYLLSAFVQPERFYSAQNIKVLSPIQPMTMAEKAYYCTIIRANRPRYSTHGREANRSFDNLLVPSRSEIPAWVHSTTQPSLIVKEDNTEVLPTSVSGPPKLVRLDSIFEPRNGLSLPPGIRSKTKIDASHLPYIRPSKLQITSYAEYVDAKQVPTSTVFERHTLYVSTNGQGSHTYSYVSSERFVPNSDVTVLIPKRPMSLQEKVFYAAVITANRPRFSYGRKPKGERLKGLLVPNQAPKFVYENPSDHSP